MQDYNTVLVTTKSNLKKRNVEENRENEIYSNKKARENNEFNDNLSQTQAKYVVSGITHDDEHRSKIFQHLIIYYAFGVKIVNFKCDNEVPTEELFNRFLLNIDPLYFDEERNSQNLFIPRFIDLKLVKIKLTEDQFTRMIAKMRLCNCISGFYLEGLLNFTLDGYKELFKALRSFPTLDSLHINQFQAVYLNEFNTKSNLTLSYNVLELIGNFVQESKILKDFGYIPWSYMPSIDYLINSLCVNNSIETLTIKDTHYITDMKAEVFQKIYRCSTQNENSFKSLKKIHFGNALLNNSYGVNEKQISALISLLKSRPNIKFLYIGFETEDCTNIFLRDFLPVDTIEHLYVREGYGDKEHYNYLKYITQSKKLRVVLFDDKDFPVFHKNLIKSITPYSPLELLMLKQFVDIVYLDELFKKNHKIRVGYNNMHERGIAFNFYNTLCMANPSDFKDYCSGNIFKNNDTFLNAASLYQDRSLYHLHGDEDEDDRLTCYHKIFKAVIGNYNKDTRLQLNETLRSENFHIRESTIKYNTTNNWEHLLIVKKYICLLLAIFTRIINQKKVPEVDTIKQSRLYIQDKFFIHYLIQNGTYLKNLVIFPEKKFSLQIEEEDEEEDEKEEDEYSGEEEK